jgi:potassium efflux system protein
MKALQSILQQTLTYLGNKQDYEQRLDRPQAPAG